MFVDLNLILLEADAAKDAAEQIEKIAIKIEEEIKVLPKFDPDISMRVRTSHQSVPWI